MKNTLLSANKELFFIAFLPGWPDLCQMWFQINTQYLIHLNAYRNSLVCLFKRKCKQDSLYNFLAVSIICFPIQVLTYGWRGILRQYFTFLSRVNNLTCFICFCNSRVEQQPWYQSIVGHNFPLRFSDFCKGAIAPRINFPFNKGLLLNPHQRPTLAKIVKISPPFTFWPSYRFICTLLEKKLHRKFRPVKDFDLTLKGSYKHQILSCFLPLSAREFTKRF